MNQHVELETLSAFLDGALTADEAAQVRAHEAECAACSRELKDLARAREFARRGPRFAAPDVLSARIRGLAAQRVLATREPDKTAPLRWWRMAAAAVLIAVASSTATFAVLRERGAPAIESELVASHIRSLMPGHSTDVVSTDQHQVKPWFNGRVDLSPPVPNLDSLGFMLIGGRLDYVAGRPVAVVVYGVRKHIIDVYSWPASDEASGTRHRSAMNGYHMVAWRADGVDYWAVSDLNVAELESFVSRYRGY
jgi:anti-sigma factor RsiW